MFLAGDIGGTNCRYALFDGQKLHHVRTWPTSQSSGLREDIARYKAEIKIGFERACVAVAGPIYGERVSLTNANWQGHLQDFPCPAVWVNDLLAAIQGLSLASYSRLFGPDPGHGLRLAIGVGTGYGQALGVFNQAFAAEGGHASYAPNNAIEQELWQYLIEKNTRVRVEDVCSGRGMENILDFLSLKHGVSIDRTQPAGYLFGTQHHHEIFAQGLDIFLSSLGSAIGDTILRILPTGGIWLCGGVAQKMKPHFLRPSFVEALYNKAPMKQLIERTSIMLVEEPDLGLLGAGYIAQKELGDFHAQ